MDDPRDRVRKPREPHLPPVPGRVRPVRPAQHHRPRQQRQHRGPDRRVRGLRRRPDEPGAEPPATADSQCASTEGPEKAVNGSTSGGNSDKWCSTGGTKFLRIDLGAVHRIQSVTVHHAAAGGEDPAWNTRDFDLQASADGSTWTTVAQVRGSTAGVSSHPMSVDGRYLLVKILTPTQTTDPAARLYEVEVYGT
ncbi:discoidin domain-containing protein [Micromonospora fulviviridis]|uniref:discoidin domain-containing protein n=1 Tax=Micromonospora fulviviridis TaxID=47860 RepID=UPI0037B814F1